MPKLLFGLSNVPEDEAEEVRELLVEHGADFYETDSGRWGFGVAAIWLADESGFDEFRSLIDAYQQARYQRSRDEYQELSEQGEYQGFLQKALQQPLKVLLVVLGVSFVAGITVYPFLKLIVK